MNLTTSFLTGLDFELVGATLTVRNVAACFTSCHSMRESNGSMFIMRGELDDVVCVRGVY